MQVSVSFPVPSSCIGQCHPLRARFKAGVHSEEQRNNSPLFFLLLWHCLDVSMSSVSGSGLWSKTILQLSLTGRRKTCCLIHP